MDHHTPTGIFVPSPTPSPEVLEVSGEGCEFPLTRQFTYSKENESGKSNLSSNIFDKKKTIYGGYVKKGQLATEDDAKALGFNAESSTDMYICNRYDEFAMFYFKDEIITSGKPRKYLKEITSIRGWIMNIVTKKVVCKSFSDDSMLFVEPDEIKDEDWKDYVFTPHVEGTTIRMFWDGRTWKYSTHRKINCEESRIPIIERLILDLFEDAWPDFSTDILNKDLVYIFHIVHQDNQIMNPNAIEVPVIYHLGTLYASNHPEKPLEIADAGGKDERYVLPGVKYLPELSIAEVRNSLSQNSIVIARKGFNITQIMLPFMEEALRIRGCSAPYVTPELMYMRSKPKERKVLINYVSFDLKERVSEEYMSKYIEDNVSTLALFCSSILCYRLGGNSINLTSTLTWLSKQITIEVTRTSLKEITLLYQNKITQLVDTNGETIYRCFRDMDAALKKFSLKEQKELESIFNGDATEKKFVANSKGPQEKRNQSEQEKRNGSEKKVVNTRSGGPRNNGQRNSGQRNDGPKNDGPKNNGPKNNEQRNSGQMTPVLLGEDAPKRKKRSDVPKRSPNGNPRKSPNNEPRKSPNGNPRKSPNNETRRNPNSESRRPKMQGTVIFREEQVNEKGVKSSQRERRQKKQESALIPPQKKVTICDILDQVGWSNLQIKE